LFDNGQFRFDYGSGNTGLTPTIGISAGDGVNYTVASYDGMADLNMANSLDWVVNNTPITVSLPNIVRGPGQSVAVPATRTGLPISISEGSQVTDVSFTLTYDPSLLNVTAVVAGSGLPADANMHTQCPGRYRSAGN
jgi:hypothetical protein